MNAYKITNLQLPLVLISVLILLAIPSCKSSGSAIVYGEIAGEGSVNENSYTDYKIDASGPKAIGYEWVVEPASAGTFTNGNQAHVTFNPAEVTIDTTATIKVMLTANPLGPWMISKEIAILDTNQMPRAVASSDKDNIGHGQSVQFFDESTDPEGDTDIVKWEWDFSFDDIDGFNCDVEEKNPLHMFPDPGNYNVQLQITDRSNVTDLLQQPLVIEVVENHPPVVTGVYHNRTTSQMGNNDEAVQLSLLFEDLVAPVGGHTFRWSCAHGSFDDDSIQNPVWYPPAYVVECEISVIITDFYGLTGSGSCMQWVTGLPVRANNQAPGNLIIPDDLDTVYSGLINPGTWVFPNDPADGNVVFMSFWATWSSPCVQGMPVVLSVNNLYESNPDFRHVMVNESEPVDDVFSFIHDNSYEAMYWALDADASYFGVTKGWNGGSNTLPQHLIFDRDGRCRWAEVGVLEGTGEIQAALEEML